MTDNSKEFIRGISISSENFLEIQKEIKNISNFRERIEVFSSKGLSELVETILGGGIQLEASDIHVEPEKKQAKIRARIDGLLQDITIINQQAYEELLSRIKLLAGVKLNISDRPQDGRFSVLIPEKGSKISVEIRVSVLPAEHGESLVLRILNPKKLINLEELGLREDLFNLFKREIKKPNGMVILTGPTGSGKTTTLYAFLKNIQNPEIKIITIEDPIEYHLEGISQTQVDAKKGYDFASGLQSIMRQDPDVILVGEIRDEKTCQIGLQAALTGHLVFSTLHTNDAAGTIARLTNLGGDLTNIGPAINLAIAQRLIRKVCKKCGKLTAVSPLDLMKIKKSLAGIPKSIKIPSLDKKLKILKSKGCKHCNFTGYQGRIGIFEAILINDEIEDFILKNPSIAALRKEAAKSGMVSVRQDGFIKVLEGITTIEEIERVTGK